MLSQYSGPILSIQVFPHLFVYSHIYKATIIIHELSCTQGVQTHQTVKQMHKSTT